jgi:hypothetical protein
MTSRHFQMKNNQKKTKKSSKKKSRFFGSRKQKKKENNNFLMKSSRKKTTKKRSVNDGTTGTGMKRKIADVEEESFVSLQPSDYDEKKNNIVKFPYEIIAKSNYLSTAIKSVEKKEDIGVIPVPIDYNTLIKIQSILTRNLRRPGMNRTLDDYVDLLLATHYLDMKGFYDHIMNSLLNEEQIYEILNESKYSDKLNQDIINDIFSKLSHDRKKLLMLDKKNDISLSHYVLDNSSSIEIKYYYIIKKTVPPLDDMTKKKLKVYVCLNPLESVNDFSSLEEIQTKVNQIAFVTDENKYTLNERNINVIENDSFFYEPLSNILNNNTNIDYYIDHDSPYNGDYDIICLKSVVFYGFRKILDHPPRYTSCRGKISFKGMTSLEIVEDNWLRDTNAREIEFTGLMNLKEVGNYWLFWCVNLVTVNLEGLGNLKEVKNFWLSNCNALTTVNFTGLNQLREVGHEWLRRCNTLETVNFTGLNNLEKVGNRWLSDCTTLHTVNFRGLIQLREVGNSWLFNCRALNTVDFTGLSNLEKVGNYWLYDCTTLQTVNFTGLNNLKEVGNRWLSYCEALTTVNFTGLSQLREVSHGWLSDCEALETVNFTGLNNLKKVGDYWLYDCTTLQTVNFTGLNNLEKVGDYWLSHCNTLQTVNFTGLIQLREVGIGWLSDCRSLTTVILTDLNHLGKVGVHWLVNCENLNKSLINFNPLTNLRQIGDINISNIDDIRTVVTAN